VASPLDRVLGIPNELNAVLRLLPQMAKDTAAMARATRSLPKIERTMEDMKADTVAIGELNESMTEVAKLTAILEPMDARMAAIEGTMPALLEVQGHLTGLPDTLERLEASVTTLSASLEKLMVQLDDLGESVDGLQTTIRPLRRIASHLPGRSRQPEPEAEAGQP